MEDTSPGASSRAYGAAPQGGHGGVAPAPTGWPPPPDLATQLEDLISTVWESEENWRFDDRLDLASGHLPTWVEEGPDAGDSVSRPA
jgi:hypothetical protein